LPSLFTFAQLGREDSIAGDTILLDELLDLVEREVLAWDRISKPEIPGHRWVAAIV
jgi:hypothetical protein